MPTGTIPGEGRRFKSYPLLHEVRSGIASCFIFGSDSRTFDCLGKPDPLFEGNFLLYEYVEYYWKLCGHDASEADFDLEECFTLIECHERRASHRLSRFLRRRVEGWRQGKSGPSICRYWMIAT